MASDYKDQLLYTQEAMDMAVAKAKLKGEITQFVIDEQGSADQSKVKRIAQALETTLEQYTKDLPHDAQLAAELLESALKIFISTL